MRTDQARREVVPPPTRPAQRSKSERNPREPTWSRPALFSSLAPSPRTTPATLPLPLPDANLPRLAESRRGPAHETDTALERASGTHANRPGRAPHSSLLSSLLSERHTQRSRSRSPTREPARLAESRRGPTHETDTALERASGTHANRPGAPGGRVPTNEAGARSKSERTPANQPGRAPHSSLLSPLLPRAPPATRSCSRSPTRTCPASRRAVVAPPTRPTQRSKERAEPMRTDLARREVVSPPTKGAGAALEERAEPMRTDLARRKVRVATQVVRGAGRARHPRRHRGKGTTLENLSGHSRVGLRTLRLQVT